MISFLLSFLIIVGVLGSPIAIIFNWINIPDGAPHWPFIFGVPAILLFLLASFAGIRLQNRSDSQYGREYIALESLARLREEGTALWNNGLELENTDEVSSWIDQIRDWQSRVTVQIAVLSSVEAYLFQTLRFFSAPALKHPINFPHSLNFRMLHRRLEIIEELIRRFSP